MKKISINNFINFPANEGGNYFFRLILNLILLILTLAISPAGAEKLGGAYITTDPGGAFLRLDDEERGKSPIMLGDLTEGDHILKINLPGYRTVLTNIEIKAGVVIDYKYNLKAEYGILSINTRPRGAEVYLDGKYIGKAPKRITDILATEHFVKIDQPGYMSWENKLKTEPDKESELHVELEPEKKFVPPPDHKSKSIDSCRTECHDVTQTGGKLSINSTPPGAEVYVNNEKKGEAPLTLFLFPGKYKVMLQKTDYIPRTTEVALDYKQEENIDFTLDYNNDLKNLIYIPAGEFTMGADRGNKDNQPAHKVYLGAYYIDKYEVTNAQYKEFVLETGYRQPSYQFSRQWGADNQPVVGISWEDAAAYAKWAKKRLPTEAEWEKAAKGLTQNLYPWGEFWQVNFANTHENGRNIILPVGSFPKGASPFGVLDMIGNVAEWCADWYDPEYYAQSPAKNPKGPAEGRSRVVRGGSWQDTGVGKNVNSRFSLSPQVRLNSVGFRCVADVPF